jgi:phosphotransacetylase
VLLAAAEVTQRGLAKIVLLGDPQTVANEAKKAGADISGCTIVDPQVGRGLARAGPAAAARAPGV